MQVDSRAGLASLRVLYEGPAGATRILNLRRLQALAGWPPLQVLRLDDGRVLRLALRSERLPTPGLGYVAEFEVSSVLAAEGGGAQRELLRGCADGVVFLPERADPRSSQTRQAWEELTRALAHRARRPRVFVVNYLDAPVALEARDFLFDGEPARLVSVEGDGPADVERVFVDLARQLVGEAAPVLAGLAPGSEEAAPRRTRRAEGTSAPTLRRPRRPLGPRLLLRALALSAGTAALAALAWWLASTI